MSMKHGRWGRRTHTMYDTHPRSRAEAAVELSDLLDQYPALTGRVLQFLQDAIRTEEAAAALPVPEASGEQGHSGAAHSWAPPPGLAASQADAASYGAPPGPPDEPRPAAGTQAVVPPPPPLQDWLSWRMLDGERWLHCEMCNKFVHDWEREDTATYEGQHGSVNQSGNSVMHYKKLSHRVWYR